MLWAWHEAQIMDVVFQLCSLINVWYLQNILSINCMEFSCLIFLKSKGLQIYFFLWLHCTRCNVLGLFSFLIINLYINTCICIYAMCLCQYLIMLYVWCIDNRLVKSLTYMTQSLLQWTGNLLNKYTRPVV